MRQKKVAIIGAGPSGLVTAKTLLHNWPRGTYSPTIFDARHEVGGLWPNQSPEGSARQPTGSPGTLDPCMRTNLSRFTVAFSDLSWESALGRLDVPMFPQARQVGQYLAAYTNRYIPADVLRLGYRVVRTERLVGADASRRWRVSWIRGGSQKDSQETTQQTNKIESEDFDLLVVASGYFSRPYVPALPRLEHFTGQVIHSSALEKGRSSPTANKETTPRGHTVVIGGSMSGVEAASALALRESSLHLSTDPDSGSSQSEHKVYHIHSRPFWTLPTYLPYETSELTVSFLPLDLVMYDLSRRPPGPIEYGIGPLSEKQIAKTNGYFRSLLGAEHERYGHSQKQFPSAKANSQPEWVAIGNEYPEFVRAGVIQPIMGRVSSVHPQSDTGIASIEIETDEGYRILEDVTSIVMATGFTPFDSLSFLPDDVLSTLEYTTSDPFLPLILDKGGTLRSEIPDLGFVGFYRGPYWGVMEMQARFLGKVWAVEHHYAMQAESHTKDQRENLRIIRQPDAEVHRAQFPMGDYVGLMETFAKDLNIERIALSDDESPAGPVVPARYTHEKDHGEVRCSLDSLQIISHQEHPMSRAVASLAVFRALHGKWTFARFSETGQRTKSGTVAFIPRYPSDPRYDREYVMETRRDASPAGNQAASVGRTVFGLSGGSTGEFNTRIEVHDVTIDGDKEAHQSAYLLHLTPFYRKQEMGEYVIYARGLPANPTERLNALEVKYTFHFQGVSIIQWECDGPDDNDDMKERINAESRPRLRRRTVYKR